MDDKTIDGMLLSSLLRSGRLGPVCERLGAELRVACMTAMISGPRYGSTSELQRAVDLTRSRAQRQYTPPVKLFLERDKKMCTHSKERPLEFRITCFCLGNTCRSSVLYRAKHENSPGELCAKWQVPPRLWRSGLRRHSQVRSAVTIASTKSRPPIGPQKRVPQNELEARTTIAGPDRMFAFIDDMIIEVLLAQFLPFSVCPTWA